MTLAGILPDDIVKVDKKGRVFYAKVTGNPLGRDLPIQPIGRETYTVATAHEVVEHYKKMGRPRPAGHKRRG